MEMLMFDRPIMKFPNLGMLIVLFLFAKVEFCGLIESNWWYACIWLIIIQYLISILNLGMLVVLFFGCEDWILLINRVKMMEVLIFGRPSTKILVSFIQINVEMGFLVVLESKFLSSLANLGMLVMLFFLATTKNCQLIESNWWKCSSLTDPAMMEMLIFDRV